ncbi:hypothetical protein EVAR_8355_1 [Eumeta japonica]|uniref:Uncharacterized protein n=1 Tax=Eumeta variegata TaxID=151549 RepID=A0A4C1VE33_EUMVA|nr:hypothetical protein EVAR_8355_1 [Eumeta japonica]
MLQSIWREEPIVVAGEVRGRIPVASRVPRKTQALRPRPRAPAACAGFSPRHTLDAKNTLKMSSADKARQQPRPARTSRTTPAVGTASRVTTSQLADGYEAATRIAFVGDRSFNSQAEVARTSVHDVSLRPVKGGSSRYFKLNCAVVRRRRTDSAINNNLAARVGYVEAGGGGPRRLLARSPARALPGRGGAGAGARGCAYRESIYIWVIIDSAAIDTRLRADVSIRSEPGRDPPPARTSRLR